ncbi:hypothetical protein EWM62_12315 [Mucilaginibacter terrigena]|uniref:IPT/TIG domain-containing protein n=1 Tax=Mucilaginibacter terrigena TaxID=2492395 RepID=A0A4Q5LMQ2_9SPHI|nr:IPT/TIG domain-containing protein [Mucilaginibacter terrigena]RYU90305.1 hypothetical protein EWM62_12315 [Mucilaginibacter terrigena]
MRPRLIPFIIITALLAVNIFFSSCSKHKDTPVPVIPAKPEEPATPVQDEVIITSLSVNEGRYNDTVLINGSGFNLLAPGNKVTFNNKEAVVAAATGIQLKVAVPLSAGTGVIKVVNGKKSATGPAFTYNYTQLITVLAGNGSLNHPSGLAVNANGDIFVADEGSNRIKKVTKDGVVTTFAGNGTAGSTDGSGVAASFNHPFAIAIDKNENLFVTELAGYVIRKITPEGVVTTVAGSGVKGYKNGNGRVAEFGELRGIAVNDNGDLYVTDRYNSNLRKITTSGEVTTYIQTGGQTGSLATIAIDYENNIYFTDVALSDHPYSVNSAYKINNTGITRLDVSAAGFSSYGLGAIAADSKGNKYIGSERYQILRISPTGVKTSLSEKPAVKTTNSLTVNARAFYEAYGMTADEKGNCYITDDYKNQILKVGLQ